MTIDDPLAPSPDPVTQAAAYQASLLAALGEDDPAEVQASTPAALRTLVADAGDDVRTPPEPANGPSSSASATSPTASSWPARATAGSSPRRRPT